MVAKTNNERLAILEVKTNDIESKIGDIHKLLLGNGHPGLYERAIISMENIEQLTKNIEYTNKNISGLEESVKALKDIITVHIGNREIHVAKSFLEEVALRGKWIPYLILITIAIHSIIPGEFNLVEFVWKLIMGLFI
jgi:hypothetical protein